jgi:hypothetical protein
MSSPDVIARIREAASGAGDTAAAGAARGRWLARGAWLLALAEVAVVVKSHIDRLEPKERSRLVEIVKSSKGRPSNLDDKERRELRKLIDKIGPGELARSVASRVTGIARGKR